MGKSLIRKIIESHYVSGSMKAGEEVFIKVDQTLTHDINAVMTYLAFETIGLDRIRTECSVSYLDHNLLGFYALDDANQDLNISINGVNPIGKTQEELKELFPDLEMVSAMQSRYPALVLLER